MTVLSLFLVAATAQATRTDDVVLAIASFEATTAAAGDSGWTAIAVDGAAGGAAWARARAEFELPQSIEAGEWMLCVGPPGLDVAARLNGTELERVPDACAGDPAFAAGPRFDVSSVALRSGANRLELAFRGPRLGAGLERGPAYLLSRTPAARLRDSAATSAAVPEVANFAALGSGSRDAEHLLDRIAFKFAEDGGTPRLAGQLDLSLLDGDTEVPVRALGERRLGAGFPTCNLELKDPRFPKLRTQLVASAPLLTTPLRLSDAKAIVLDLHQAMPRETFELVFRLRFFPAAGGPLRVVRGEGYILLRNDVVGVFAEEARVLGSEAAPVGLVLILSSQGVTGTRVIGGVTRRCGIVAYETEPLDPSQADSMEDLVETLLGDAADDREAIEEVAGALANEPFQGAVAAGLATRLAAVATLEGMRRRGSRFVYAPRSGAQSAEAFWSDTFTLLHFPVHERNTVEWLLSTQEDDGAVRGDLPPEAAEIELAAADAYAVLRACRWFRWTYDGDRFVELVPQLARALEHADSVDLAASRPPAPPGDRERLSTVHVALARAAAHRELATAVEQLGRFEEMVASSVQAAGGQLDALLRAPERGGRLTERGFLDEPEDDPRDSAIALVYELLEPAQVEAVAAQLAAIASAQPLDWRDALVTRALLQAGRKRVALDRWKQLDEQVRSGSATPAAIASYHGTLCFGLLGMRREDLGTVEMRPHLSERQILRAAIPFREGAVRVQMLPADAQMRRQVIVENQSALDLMVVVGVPGGIGSGERVKTGEIAHTLYRQIVPQGGQWRELLK